VGASPFIGFLSEGLFVSHGLRDWRTVFAGPFRDSWSFSGAQDWLEEAQETMRFKTTHDHTNLKRDC
jgi:hypothetical protein